MSKAESEIVEFLRENVTPMETNFSGTFYRASAYLTDGTYLPCVMFGNPNAILKLASRRFAETAKNAYEHRMCLRCGDLQQPSQ
ncbi:MAG: hypothetical protein WKF92_04760 [Pyrinomonadaceae bacterium]